VLPCCCWECQAEAYLALLLLLLRGLFRIAALWVQRHQQSRHHSQPQLLHHQICDPVLQRLQQMTQLTHLRS
jgi:hypothetical protein